MIKEVGANEAYRDQTAAESIERFRDDPSAPAVEYLAGHLPDEDMPRLYAACQALVHPYRGEGFGLPILEAMACGLPVLITAGGSADDFCPPAAAYRVPAERVYLPQNQVGPWETVARPWLLEPDLGALTAALRHVQNQPNQAEAVGRAGRCAALGFTWAAMAAAIERRVRALQPDDRHTPGRPTRVSLTMIVRNEETNLPECLAGLRELFEEIIIVDTGSTDRTREIATAHGAAVTTALWTDSFADARNAALDRATGDYVFWLDADDRLDAENREQLRALFATLPAAGTVAYVLKCRCRSAQPDGPDTLVDHVRLFPRRPNIRWEFRVHEQILPALRAAGVEVRWADITILHIGYTDPTIRAQKLARDRRLLEAEFHDQPGHPFALFNLGSMQYEQADYAAALESLEQSLAASHPQDSIVRKLHALIALCHAQLGQPDSAQATIQAGLTDYPDDLELLYLDADGRRVAGDVLGAERSLQRLLVDSDTEHFASVDGSIRQVKARHLLALCYLDLNRPESAAAEWQRVIAVDPRFRPASWGLGELAIRHGEHRLLEVALNALADDPLAVAELQARWHLQHADYPAARVVLDPATRTWPRHLPFRRLLSHAWLRDGTNPAAAAQALRAVLELAPDDDEARQNLSVLFSHWPDDSAPIVRKLDASPHRE